MYNIDVKFLSTPDKNMDINILNKRIEKEKKSTENVIKLSKEIKTITNLHEWLFTDHDCYSCKFNSRKKIDKKLLDSYQ